MMLFHFIDYADYWQAPGQQGAEFEVRLAKQMPMRHEQQLLHWSGRAVPPSQRPPLREQQ
jgi:hypothetical protein